MNTTLTIKNRISDTTVMCGRVLRHTLRSVDTIITVIAMPVMMMLASVYVYGGAMDLGRVNYIDYIVPGILLFCIVSGVAYSAVRLNNDVTKGIFERFHSMPIAKSSILGGHVLTSVLFNAVSVLAVLLVALLIGFRPGAGIVGWLLASGILLLFTLAMTWIAVTFGLLAKSLEGSGVFSYLLMILIFTSSAFAPTGTMPAALRYFAEVQPMTPIIDSVRSLLMTGTVSNAVWLAILWCVGIWIFFHLAAMRIYKRRIE
ncbi:MULTISPECIES: ABC transporter permease [unclassified Dehalobacter]|uniref:ABC transporter permease n=1 Tax=unclassified Dehalobacter TaxID=2635733 RepID=UPI000E6CF202|nr:MULTISPECIES: ABC transporter permease [unclassified Dehalobacter]RJE47162.1 ABC transporter permease [Dehalobacter sp. MCB1]TCX53675.1 ABC transporter permease [Dehalobacter sp. 14DCB1]TCX54978.1 ABC transporter permease [Dehalobacter sp. 12DCB1]